MMNMIDWQIMFVKKLKKNSGYSGNFNESEEENIEILSESELGIPFIREDENKEEFQDEINNENKKV